MIEILIKIIIYNSKHVIAIAFLPTYALNQQRTAPVSFIGQTFFATDYY